MKNIFFNSFIYTILFFICINNTSAESLRINGATSTTVCYGTTGITFSASAIFDCSNNSFNLEYSYNGVTFTGWGNFSTCSNSMSCNMQYTATITQTMYFRLRTHNNGPFCSADYYSNVVVIYCLPQISGGTMSSDQTICYNSNPTQIIGTAPTSGSPSYTYKWQKSSDNLNWADITGATSQSYSPSNLTITTFYRRITAFSSCGSYTSSSVKINVLPPVGGGNIYSDQAICYNTVPSKLTGTVGSGGNGIYSYQWQVFNGSWTNVPGATDKDYQPPVLTSLKYYDRLTTSASCTSVRSNSFVTVGVFSELTAGSISSAQTICTNSSPLSLTGTSPSGGNNTYTYQWQESTDNVNWKNIISNSTSNTYQPGILSTSNYYRRLDNSNNCTAKPTNAIKITVNAGFTAGIIGNNQTICFNNIPATIVETKATSGLNDTFTYQWYSSNDDVSYSVISGATSTSYLPLALTTNTYFKRNDISSICGSKFTNTIKVTVTPEITAGTITPSATQTICYNTAPLQFSVSLPSGGNGNYTYQWQSTTDGTNFTNIPGATSITYQAPKLTIQAIGYRLAVNSSTCETAYTDMSVVWVKTDLLPGTIGNSQNICYNTSPSKLISSGVSGGDYLFYNPIYKYQWQVSDNSNSWIDILDATSSTYQPGILTQNKFYRLRVTNDDCISEYSNTISITVSDKFIAGKTGTDHTICYNNIPNTLTETLSSLATSYEWYSSNDNVSYSLITGAASKTYLPTALTKTTYFKRNDINSCGSSFTNISVVTVKPVITPGTLSPVNQLICYNTKGVQITGTSATGGDGNFSYQWQESLDEVNWSDIPGGTSLNYSPVDQTTKKYYRRKESSFTCDSKYTSTVYIDVLSDIIAGTISSDQTLCYNTTPVKLNSSGISGGSATGQSVIYSYQWQSSTNLTTWTNIVINGTSNTYQPGVLTQTTNFRLNVSSNGCSSKNTNIITVTVFPDLTSGNVTGPQTICNNSQPALLSGSLPTGGNGTYTYQWYQSSDQINASLISGAVLQDYQPTSLTSTTYYKRVVSSFNCASKQSAWIKMSVQNSIVSGTVTSSQDIAYNTSPTSLNSTPASGGNGTFTYQWQTSLDDTLFANISGANSTSYQPGNLKSTSYYRILTYSNGCGPISSKSVSINVFGQLKPGTISSSQTICYDTAPNQFTGTAPVGGSGGFLFQWYKSTNKQLWEEIVDGNATNYTAPALIQTGYYKRRVIASLSEDTAYSNIISISVRNSLSAGSISIDGISIIDTTCTGQIGGRNITGPIAAGGSGNYEYTWEDSYNSSTWVSAGLSATGQSYETTGKITQDLYYRRKVKDLTCGVIVYSNSVKFDLISPISDGLPPINQTVCYNSKPIDLIFTPVNGGEGKYIYQWQESLDSLSWFDINGGTTAILQPPALIEKKWYRRNVTSKYCLGNLSEPIKVDVLNYFNPGTISDNQTICYNTTPIQLKGTIPTGATNSYTYQWQNSLNGNSWNTIIGAMFQNYSPGKLTTNTYYRRKAIGGSCNSEYTNTILISVLNNINPGAIKATSQTVCYNSDLTAMVTLTDADGGDQDFNYQWQSSTDGFNWNDITGATSSNYKPSALKTITYFRKNVISTCGNYYTNSEKITVYSPLSSGSISSNQTIAFGKTPSIISGALANGANGIYTYQWQFSNDSINWVDVIVNGSKKDFQPGPLFDTTYFKRIVSSSCGLDVSNVVKIIVTPKLEPGVISSNQTICYNTSPTQLTGSEPKGSNGEYFYRWQLSDDGHLWTNISSNAINTTYSPTSLTKSKYFRRLVYTAIKDSFFSNIVLINVYGALSGGSLLGKNTICYNEEAPIITASPGEGGSGSYTYQWQLSNNLVSWSNINSISSDYIDPSNLKLTSHYRRKISDMCGTKYSDTVSIIVRGVFQPGSIEKNQTIAHGKIPTLLSGTIASGGDNNYIYLWQFSNKGKNWSNVIVNGNNKDYQPSALYDTTHYRRIDITGCGQDTTNTITINVMPIVIAGTISSNQTICYNTIPSKLTSTGATGGNEIYSYQWQFSITGTNWQNVLVNSSTKDYQPGAIISNTYFRLAVKCQNYDTVFSNIILLDNFKSLSGGKITTDTKDLCYGSSPMALITNTYPTGGAGSYTYQWQESINRAVWNNISNAFNDYYIESDQLTQTTYYRKKVTDQCGIDYSDTIKIVVKSKFSAGIIGSDQVIGIGEIPNGLTGTTPIGGLGKFQYQWIKSSDQKIWNISINDTLIGLNPTNLKDTTYYERIDQTTCGMDTTNTVKIIVLPNFKPGELTPLTQIACYNNRPNEIKGTSATGGNGSYTYQWQYSFDGNSWIDINGANSQSYLAEPVTVKTFFRRVDKTQHFANVNTLNSTVDVYSEINSPTIKMKPSYCKNSSVQLEVNTPDNKLTYQWLDYKNTFLSNGSTYIINNLIQDTKIYIQAENLTGCKSAIVENNVKLDSIKASFHAPVVFIENGNAIKFINNSVNAINYSWNFFEGDVMYEAEPFHYYNSTGKKDVLLTVTSGQGCKDSLMVKGVIEVFPRNISSIFENSNPNLTVTAFPVPIENELNIEFGKENGNYELKIVNTLGQNMESFENLETNKIKLNTENWAPGVYYLIVKEDKTIQTLKIVK